MHRTNDESSLKAKHRHVGLGVEVGVVERDFRDDTAITPSATKDSSTGHDDALESRDAADLLSICVCQRADVAVNLSFPFLTRHAQL